MNSPTKFAVAAVLGILVLVGLGWLLAANDLAFTSVFGPKREEVRRNTFEQSKSFRDGVVQELRSMQFDYVRAAPAHQKGLASVIRHKATELDIASLPQDLQTFLKTLP